MITCFGEIFALLIIFKIVLLGMAYIEAAKAISKFSRVIGSRCSEL